MAILKIKNGGVIEEVPVLRGPPGEAAEWESLTQAEYDALTPEAGKVYLVVGS